MDFRYLVETKNEFNNFLSDILVPHIYNGIKGMFKYSENVYSQLEEKKKRGVNVNNPGIISIFKKTLDGISGLNNHEIEEEYSRIKNSSGFSEWFDLLVKASFKSYVLFLTWDPQTEQSKYSDNKFYENIIIKDYIHKCYIISCNFFKDNPDFFVNKSKREIFDIIKNCLNIAMKKSLPYNSIIEEYLSIDFTKKDTNAEEIHKIKNLVNGMINNNKYGKKPVISKIFTEESDNNKYDGISKKEELENFINLELINQNKKQVIQPINPTTSEMLTRSNVKSKEVIDIIEEASKKSILDNDGTITSETSETSEAGLSNDESTSENSVEDTNIILNSPPAIKKKVIDRIGDDINNSLLNKKKNIEVVLNNNNNTSENFDKLETYYDNLIKTNIN